MSFPALMENTINVIHEGFIHKNTCMACPEQWESFYDGKQVGYIRVRFGTLRVYCPGALDKLVLEHTWDGDDYKGRFDSVEERREWLHSAHQAIKAWLSAISPSVPA